MYIGLYVRCPLFVSRFNETSIFSTDFRKTLKYQISIKSVEWEVRCSMRTKGRTDRYTHWQTWRRQQSLFAILRTRPTKISAFCVFMPFVLFINKGKGHPATGRGGPRVSGSVKAPDFLDVRHYKGGKSSAKHTGRLYSRRSPWYSFSWAESTSEHMVPSGGATEKIPSDTTGNRSRDRPTSSAVP